MMSERTKTILLVIGIVLACILLLQGFGFGIESSGDGLNLPSRLQNTSMEPGQLFQFKETFLKFWVPVNW